MKRILASLVAAAILAPVSFLAAQNGANAMRGVETGKVAPDFTLVDTNGTSHDLSDFRGKTVVLEWTNHQCPFVVKHYRNGDMQRLQADATAKGVVWLRIISSAPGTQGHVTPAEANILANEQNVGATATLLDPTGAVGRLYAAKTTPHMYVINGEGKLVYQGAIDSIRSASPADVAKAENYVKAALDALALGRPIATADTQPYGCSVKYASN